MNLIIYLKKEHSNKILFSFFLIFLLIGLITYKDYGIHIEEKFHRSNGFYWLNYILNFTEFNDLKNIASIKLDNISGFTLSNIESYLNYGIIFDVPTAFLEIILNIDEPKNYYQFRHLISFLLFFLSSIFFYKLLLNRFSDFNVSFIGTVFYVLSPRIYGDSFYNNKDILFLSFVTFNERSVPPLKNVEFGLSLIIFFNSLIFFGEKYFLFRFFKIKFSEFIFFKRFKVFFIFL